MTDQFAELRQRLEEKRVELEHRLSGIARDIRHEDRDIELDSQERAIELENDEVLSALGESGENELEAVLSALSRLDRGQYGICSRCGENITMTRLSALPYTELCIKCADS